MRRSIFLLSGLFIVCSAYAQSPESTPERVPGRVIVHYQNPDDTAGDRAVSVRGLQVQGKLQALNAAIVSAPDGQEDAVRQSLLTDPSISDVEFDYYAHPAATPDDPLFVSEWHLQQIQAQAAWNISKGAAVPVAVIDSGVDGSHPDLGPRLIPGWNFVSNNANTSDLTGHGTAVAGALGAATDNATGVSGVTWQGAIMPLVALDSSNYAAYSNIAAAIQYAADHGARVISISLGGSSASPVLQSAVDYAWKKGAVVFAAAMNNSNSTPMYPAACNHAIAVSATDRNDVLAGFSNFGKWISLSAPGVSILTTDRQGGYSYWGGTSLATPVAAGVAALVLGANPSLNAQQLTDVLEKSADDLGKPGFDTSYGWGRVNAYNAVLAAGGHSKVSVTVSPAKATLTESAAMQFYATVAGSSNTAVTWSISSGAGTLSQSGYYVAPSYIAGTQKITVTATSVADPKKSDSAEITLNPPNVSVTLSASTTNLRQSQSLQLAASVLGTVKGGLNWSISPLVGIISATGYYTAPSSITTAQRVTVTATSTAYPSISASIVLTLSPAATSGGGGSSLDFLIDSGNRWTALTSGGQLWSTDIAFISGSAISTTDSIAGTTQPAIYQTARRGIFVYNVPVPNGRYEVDLLFAEIEGYRAGGRIFGVAINGNNVLQNFDIAAVAGGSDIAVKRTFYIVVTNGVITIQTAFGNGSPPLINGIEIVQQ